MKSDLEIAQQAKLKPIVEIAKNLKIKDDELELYGNYKAKISLGVIDRLKGKKDGKYIDVTAITPTPLGEGKTVTTVGLSQALHYIGKNVITTLRQPSLGPVFGIKGGAAGGGYSQVIPMEDFNLHFTGDVHAVSIAHNLLSAFVDNHIHHGNKLGIDPDNVLWSRVVDVSDRALRNIVVGLGGKLNGYPRETGYDISVASEVMAILALANDLADLRKRLGKIIIGFSYKGEPITAEQLKCAGAMAVLLKDAIKPTLVQTLEHTPVFVHSGPFANIAHGNNSIIADKIAIKLGDYVVTESGFGADCGAEKMMNIKCRYSGLKPSCVVIVATVRALKMHSGKYTVRPGKPLDKSLVSEDLASLEGGMGNLIKHIENMNAFGIPVVVAVNQFGTDTAKELNLVKKRAVEAGAFAAEISDVHAKGGKGGAKLAEAVVAACDQPSKFKYTYKDSDSIKEKIEKIAMNIYGADGVDYSKEAETKIEMYTRLGHAKLPLCMAKTHLSLSHDPNLKGRPSGFRVPIRDIRLSAGAGFLYPLLGEMRTMPGLPSVPAGESIDIDKNGNIVGLF